MIIVGISGKISSGKDTAAAVMTDDFGFKKVAFADELKRTAMRWFGFTPLQLWGPSELRALKSPKFPDGPTARQVTQFLGTEVGRKLYEELWVSLLGETCARLAVGMPSSSNLSYDYHPVRGLFVREGWWPPPAGIVIPDVRFPNEIAAVKDWGGVLIRVERQTDRDDEASQHASETEQDLIPNSVFDAVIENNTTIEDYKEKVQDFIYEVVNGASD